MSGLRYEQWQVARYDVRTNTATVNDVTLPMPLHGWRPAQDADIRVMLDHRGNITHFAPTLTGVEALSKSVEEFRDNMAMHEDDVVNPKHYMAHDIEVSEMMIRVFGVEAYIDFCKINSFKYRMRAGLKKGASIIQDIQKAKWYEAKIQELKQKL
jgi:hypothetical protein